jgi:hypothetical protein
MDVILAFLDRGRPESSSSAPMLLKSFLLDGGWQGFHFVPLNIADLLLWLC